MDIERKSARNYQENICSVCHAQFSITNRSVVCSKCFQKTCRLHIYTEKTQTICENCVRLEIRKSLTHKHQTKLNQLKNDLRSLQHREKANLKEISLKSDLISSLDSTLSTQSAEFNSKLSSLESQISSESLSTQQNLQKVSEMKIELEKCKKSTKIHHEAWVSATTNLIKIQSGLTSVQQDHDTLYSKYQKLVEENSKMLTFQKIRTITCNKCYQSIVISYKEPIIQILSRKEKKSQLIPSILAINLMNSDDVNSSSCKCVVV